MNIETINPSFFDRERTIVNLANSLRKAFGLETFNPSIPEVDEILKGKKKIAVFLFDGLGAMVQDALPFECKTLIKGEFCKIFSTNPATTVAATTALRSGRYPSETGWLAWTQYYPNLNASVMPFRNAFALTNEATGIPNYLEEVGKYENLVDEVASRGFIAVESTRTCLAKNHEMDPIPQMAADTAKQMIKNADEFFRHGGNLFYSYFPEPDHSIHEYGTKSLRARIAIYKIDRAIRKFAKAHPDVTVICLSDHGMVDVEHFDVAKYPDFLECLEEGKPIVIEPRNPSFFVKKGYEERFEAVFKKYFDGKGHLLTKEQALEYGYFGGGEMNPHTPDFFGNYIAVLTTPICIYSSILEPNKHLVKAHHGGGTDAERLIRVSIFN